MRLLIAMMKHETNTFSPVPTPLARFGHGPGPLHGEAAVRAYRGTGTGLGAYLDLHGAMVTQSLEDGEGQFLRRLRTIDPVTPIAVSLDMHANLYDEIIANATVVTGYRTYPHI